MTDTALPLGSGVRIDLDRQAPGGTDQLAQDAGACLDHVARPGARRRARFARVRDLSAAVVPTLDLLVAGVVSTVALLTSTVGGGTVAATLPALWLVTLLVAGGYERDRRSPAAPRARAVLKAAAAVGVLCWLTAALTALPAASPSAATALGCLVAGSLAARRIGAGVLGAAGSVRRVVVVGRVEDVEQTIAELGRYHGTDGMDVAAACVPDVRAAGSLPLPVFRGIERAASAAAEVAADAVVVLPGPEFTPGDVRRLGWQLEAAGVALCVGVPLLDVRSDRTQVTTTGGLGILHVREAELKSARRAMKDAAERAAAALLLVTLLPVLAALAVAIRRDSPGPALFRQSRVGADGRHFTMYKFRTMTTDAEQRLDGLLDANEADGALFKLRSDPRITSLGAFLRRYSLDELPQLFNVVLGHMSLVGPRPALPAEVERYEPDARRRLAVRPGLTGLWQVSGRSDLSWEQTVSLDLHYVDNWSFALDLRIFCRTVGAVISQRGAY